MANTVLSNTNLDWISSRFNEQQDLEFDIYTWSGNVKSFSENFNADQISGHVGIEAFQYERSPKVILVAWREANNTTSYTGERTEISGGWD